MRIKIWPSSLKGSITIPPSKSHTLRSLLFSAMAQGKSTIDNALTSPDTTAMIQALQSFGARFTVGPSITVEGTAGKLIPTQASIDVGNSGQALRFVAALAALNAKACLFTGDYSIRHRRPFAPLAAAIRQLGGVAKFPLMNEHAPVFVSGPIHPGIAFVSGEDSQPISGLLIACSFLKGITTLYVDNPGETAWIDLTLSWIQRFKGSVDHHNYCKYVIQGPLEVQGFHYTVPGDFSSAAFPLVAGLLTGEGVYLHGLDKQDVQGDKKLFDLLQTMGARIDEHFCVYPSQLTGKTIDVQNIIDAVPILAVVGCFAKGSTIIENGSIARLKESDRLHAMCSELKKMGANIFENHDGLVIKTSQLKGACLFSHHDHRVAMALIIASLASQGSSTIDVDCIAKSYPTFITDMQALGANICPI